jgi:hypothetical protein
MNDKNVNEKTKEKPVRPTTEAQRAASRANGRKSRGPVTPQGKAISAMNAIKHSLYCKKVVLDTEDQENYDHIRDDYYEFFQPRDRATADMVESICLVNWHVTRLREMDSTFLYIELLRPGLMDEYESASAGVKTAMAYRNLVENYTVIPILTRQLSYYSREFHRLFRQLMEIRNQQPPQAPAQVEPEQQPQAESNEPVRNEPPQQPQNWPVPAARTAIFRIKPQSVESFSPPLLARCA